MNIFRGVLVFAVLCVVATHVTAQERPKATDTVKNITPLKVTVVFNEYDGEKKISSLPYVLFLPPEEQRHYVGSLRMGVRVPIWVAGKDSGIRYEDVGSNIDCEAHVMEDGRFLLDLRLERSALYPEKAEHGVEQKQMDPSQGAQPVLRAFRASVFLPVRDGQTAQSTVATDPLNGHVLKVDVTLNVVK